MKAPKYASKLVCTNNNAFVAILGYEMGLTHKQLDAWTFTKESLQRDYRAKELLELALNRWGCDGLKWVALCDLEPLPNY